MSIYTTENLYRYLLLVRYPITKPIVHPTHCSWISSCPECPFYSSTRLFTSFAFCCSDTNDNLTKAHVFDTFTDTYPEFTI